MFKLIGFSTVFALVIIHATLHAASAWWTGMQADSTPILGTLTYGSWAHSLDSIFVQPIGHAVVATAASIPVFGESAAHIARWTIGG